MVNKVTYPAIFLDRDGVLCRTSVRNGKPYAPQKLENFILMPNSHRSVMLLKQVGFKVIVVTNQPDIGNGFVAFEVVEKMHLKLLAKTAVDDIYICPHRQDEGCDCRKPNTGMLIAAAKKHAIDLKKSFMIGDRTNDIEAGKRAGCRTIFIDRHYNEPLPEDNEVTVNSLQSAVTYILSKNNLIT